MADDPYSEAWLLATFGLVLQPNDFNAIVMLGRIDYGDAGLPGKPTKDKACDAAEAAEREEWKG